MPTTTGASRKEAGLFYDKGGAVFNVMHPDFGATGDGVTDDHLAIQAAVTAAQAAGGGRGGRVFFPPGIYYTGTTTIAITASGVVLEMANPATYIKYAGTGYAVSFALAGAAQIHNCGMLLCGIVCTNAAGSGVYAKSPYGFFIDKFYAENGISGVTGVGVTIDGGSTAGGTGYFATHNKLSHGRCNSFHKGILFKAGDLSGWDLTTDSGVEDWFINGITGDTGSTGIEFQSSQQCWVIGGNMENLDKGVVGTTTAAGAPQDISLIKPRFETIAVNNWVIPVGGTGWTIIAPSYNTANGSDLAPNTVISDPYGCNATRLTKKTIAVTNGATNHTLARGNAGYLELSGATAAFAIGGLSGGGSLVDGVMVTVYNLTAFAMTITYNDGSATANCAIRTPTLADVVLPAGGGGSSATFVYSAAYLQWILVSHT